MGLEGKELEELYLRQYSGAGDAEFTQMRWRGKVT